LSVNFHPKGGSLGGYFETRRYAADQLLSRRGVKNLLALYHRGKHEQRGSGVATFTVFLELAV